jgi:chemotaxis protein histidine kinase CheA
MFASGADVTFAIHFGDFAYANVNQKLHGHHEFASGPLILTFANVAPRMGSECRTGSLVRTRPKRSDQLSSNETKGGKTKPSRKAKQRNRKAAAKAPEADQPRSAAEHVESRVDLAETETPAPAPVDVMETDAPSPAPDDVSEAEAPPSAPVSSKETETPAPAPLTLSEADAPPAAPADVSPAAPATVPAAAEESAPVSYRTLVDAWGSYSQTSLEQTKVYLEKLANVRSLGAALEVQAEFTKQACETFIAQTQRIAELQSELARQRMKRLEGLVGKMTKGAG